MTYPVNLHKVENIIYIIQYEKELQVMDKGSIFILAEISDFLSTNLKHQEFKTSPPPVKNRDLCLFLTIL